MTVPPERALRLALVGWGLGDLALGRRRAAVAWVAVEAVAIAVLVAATILLADTTWYLLPFLLGVAFLVVWAAKAIATFRRARALRGAAPTAQPRSPAATIAWLALPLMLWGTGFWLVAAERATPAAVIDAYVTQWAGAAAAGSIVEGVPGEAFTHLRQLCDAGRLADDCAEAPENLFRDVRFSINEQGATHATAQAEVVEFQRRPTKVFGIFEGSELVPVPVASVLRLELEARPSALGSREWVIVNATAL